MPAQVRWVKGSHPHSPGAELAGTQGSAGGTMSIQPPPCSGLKQPPPKTHHYSHGIIGSTQKTLRMKLYYLRDRALRHRGVVPWHREEVMPAGLCTVPRLHSRLSAQPAPHIHTHL